MVIFSYHLLYVRHMSRVRTVEDDIGSKGNVRSGSSAVFHASQLNVEHHRDL